MNPSHPVRSVEERVRGWVGVQRYDDLSHYGIDIIGTGRTIRYLEKMLSLLLPTMLGTLKKTTQLTALLGALLAKSIWIMLG